MKFANLNSLEEIIDKLDSLLGYLDDIIFIKDIEGKYRYVNKSFIDFYNLTYDNIIGKDDYDIFPEFAVMFIQSDKNIIKTKKSYKEIEIQDIYGKTWYGLVTKNVIIGKNGEVLGIFGLARDITKQMEFITQINEEYKLLNTILQNSPFGIFLKDRNGKYLIVNQKFASYHNKTPEEIKGLDDYDLFDELTARTYINRDMRIIRENIDKDIIINATQIGEKVYHTISTKFVTRDKNRKPNGIVGIIQDITDLKALEEKILTYQKMEVIRRMTAEVAHDLNNYLTTVLGHASLLEFQLEDKDKASVEAIIQASNKATKLIKNLLNFTREKREEHSCFKVITELQSISSLIKPTIPADIQFNTYFNCNDFELFADQSLFDQAIMNIIINAVEAIGEKGNIDIFVDRIFINSQDRITNATISAPLTSTGEFLEIIVKDTGIGISDDKTKLIFEPFYTTKHGTKGSGIGLSIVYNLIISHNGLLELDSEIGEGSTFKIYIPINKCKDKNNQKIDNKYKRIIKKRILVIDDELSTREIFADMIKFLGHDVELAPGGIEGIELMKLKQFDLVILDLLMPQMLGTEVYKEIVKINKNIPVIISSGYGKAKWHNEIHKTRSSYLYYLDKPFTVKKLEKLLEEIFIDQGCQE